MATIDPSAALDTELLSDSTTYETHRPNAVWIGFWAALTLPFLPMLVSYLLNLWNLEHYRFFPFALLAVAAIGYSRVQRPLHGPRGALAWGALAAAFVLAAASFRLGSPWVSCIGFVFLVLAFFSSQSGLGGGRLIAVAVPLLPMVRLPLGMDQLVVIRLQSITTSLSSVLLDVLSVAHAVQGNVIQLPNRELFVAEACSGIQSVFTLAFAATLLVAYHRRRLWLLPMYVVAAVVLAIFGNVLRVTIVAVAEAWFVLDLATGWPHTLLGYATLGIALLCFLSFDHLIVSLLHAAPAYDDESTYNPLLRLWNVTVDRRYRFTADDSVGYSSLPDEPARLQQRVTLSDRVGSLLENKRLRFASAAVLLVLTGVSFATASSLTIPGYGDGGGFMAEHRIVEPSEDIFDAHLQTLEILDHQQSRNNDNPQLGKNADLWQAKLGDLPAQIVLSQTYLGWHELCFCYEIDGWRVLNREIAMQSSELDLTSEQRSPEEAADSPPWHPYAYARLRKQATYEGYLFYAGIFADGEVMVPPPKPGMLGQRFTPADQPENTSDEMVMFQVWITSPKKLSPETLRGVQDDFQAMVAALSSKMKESR
ncbi:exosortase U [Novipirellula caenicola]|uniref:Transmembrane exosortase n=1 Tax=Novipirellula caenicola TaxID=1536901 RepID=A0ABP9W3I6_9BACT